MVTAWTLPMALSSVLTVMTLFFIGLISPGPNFFIVVQTTLRWGRLAGFLTGLGAATGDALYATFGLFGVAELIERGGRLLIAIKVLGGLYLVWIGAQMILRRSAADYSHDLPAVRSSGARQFAQGLATDLSNPKTIVFFASIFAVAVQPGTPRLVRLAILLGIVLTSLAWRSFLSVLFSTAAIRNVYERVHLSVERIFGGILCLFGIRLLQRATAA
jgi:amino acid exporter